MTKPGRAVTATIRLNDLQVEDTITTKQRKDNVVKTSNQKSVAPKVSEIDAERLNEHYRTINRGAQEACHFWPLARAAVIEGMKSKRLFTERETQALNDLDVPREIDRKTFQAMIDASGLKVAGRIRSLSDVEFIVLLDMIMNESTEDVMFKPRK